MTPVRLEPAAPRSRDKHSTTEPLRSPFIPMEFPIKSNTVKGGSMIHSIYMYNVMRNVQIIVNLFL